MSLMNCAFTVRWSDEKNKPHAKTYATEADAKRAKKWLLRCGQYSGSRVSYSLFPYIQKRKGGCLERWWSRVCTTMG
nr:MAG TPA: hypothetical protein [Caudoviricetes sp.]